METLPAEMLLRIVDLLDDDDARSIHKVNKALCQASAHRFYRSITICLNYATECVEYVESLGVATYVRAVRVESIAFYQRSMIFSPEEPYEKEVEAKSRYVLIQPLVYYIKSLPVLQDFYWCAEIRMPMELLQALEAKGCRLHLQRWYPDDEEVWRVAQSPTLYSIDASWTSKTGDAYEGWFAREIGEYLAEIIFAVASGRVKELELAVPPRIDIFPAANPQTLGTLTSLKLINNIHYSLKMRDISAWTDVRVLEVLHVDDIFDDDADWMASSGLFHNLRDVKFGRGEHHTRARARARAHEPLARFLAQLELEKLDMGYCCGLARADLEVIVARSRNRLKRLYCEYTSVNKAWVAEHLEPCWRLEELDIDLYSGKTAPLSGRMTRLLDNGRPY